jgi:hypothetical protein
LTVGWLLCLILLLLWLLLLLFLLPRLGGYHIPYLIARVGLGSLHSLALLLFLRWARVALCRARCIRSGYGAFPAAPLLHLRLIAPISSLHLHVT